MDDLEDLRYCLVSLILRQSVQPLDHRLHFLLIKKLPNKFFCVSFSRVINCLTDDRLTKSSPLYLFGRQCERGEELHEYLDNHLIQTICGRDLGIDLEAFQEVSN